MASGTGRERTKFTAQLSEQCYSLFYSLVMYSGTITLLLDKRFSSGTVCCIQKEAGSKQNEVTT